MEKPNPSLIEKNPAVENMGEEGYARDIDMQTIPIVGGDLSLNGQPRSSGSLQLTHNLLGFILTAHVDILLE